MTIIPDGYSQHTYLFSGEMLPTGAAITLGINFVAQTIVQEAADSRDNFQTNILPLLSSSLTFDGVLVKRGPNATGPIQFSPAGVAGGASAVGIAPNVSALVRKVTAAGGRKNRGRLFLPGMLESNVDPAGTLSPTFQETLQDAWADFAGQLVLDDMGPVVLHSDATAPTPVTSFGVDSKVATQRRRLRR